MPFGAILGAVAAPIIGGLFGANASSNAADTQAASAAAATAQQKAMFDQTTANVAPWLQAGQTALSELMSPSAPKLSNYTTNGTVLSAYDTSPAALGQYAPPTKLDGVGDPQALKAYQDYQSLNPYQSRGDFTLDKFHEDPGYQFQLQQGQNALTNAASRSGGLNSNNLKGLLGYSQGLANQDYQQAFGNYQTEAGRSLGEYQTNLQDYMAQFGMKQNVNQLNNNVIQSNDTNKLNYAGFNNAAQEQNINNANQYTSLNNAVAQQLWGNANTVRGENNSVTQQNLQNQVQNTANNNSVEQQKLNQLMAISAGGLGAGLQQGQISANVGQQIGSNIIGAGNAQAAGTVGSANAISGAIGSGYNNYLQQQLIQQYNGGASGIGSSASYANNDYLTS